MSLLISWKIKKPKILRCFWETQERTLRRNGCRSSRPDVFWRKGVLKICSKFTGEQLCRSEISTKLQTTLLKSHFSMDVLLLNLVHIFKTPFLKSTSGWLLLYVNNYNLPPACNFVLKKWLWQVFSREICEISKNTFY